MRGKAGRIAYNTHAALKVYLNSNAKAEFEYLVDRNDTVHVFNVSGGKLVKHCLGGIRNISYEEAAAVVESINS
jgi:hypothetical protein